MSSITFSGLATGLDTASIISKLMAVERQPETLLQAQQQNNTNDISEFQKIEDALTNLQTVAQGFNTSSTFSAVKSSVADSSVLTATATSSATPGTHSVQVVSLAQNQRQVSTGVASDTSLIFSTGSFTIDDGAGTTTTVNVAEGQNSLQGMVAAINASGANVSASIINDGSGTPYRLVVTGNDTKNYTLNFGGLTTAPAGGTGALVPTLLGAGDPTYQAGANAQLVVDGVTMTKTSNTVTDAIQGITLNLQTGGGVTTNVTVSTDTDSVTQKINNFVTAYNSVITLVNSESAYDPKTNKAGVLSGDATVQSIQSQLQSLLTTSVPGTSGTFNTLADLGINSDAHTGTLSVDSTKLSAALANHYNDVVDYFTHNGNSVATLPTNQYGIAQQFNVIIDTMVHPYIADGDPKNGLIENVKKSLTNTNSSIDQQISDMEDRISQMQTNMQNQFAAMELMVSNLQSQGNSLLAYLGSTSSSTKS